MTRMSEMYTDFEPEEEIPGQGEEALPLISPEDFYDLLMEQQEQM